MNIFYEMDKTYEDILKEKKNFLFIGEAGSGKSEIVLNTAIRLAEMSGKKVDVFDMDQTKPLFRSRDLKDAFASKDVNIYFQEQYLDAPTSVGGVQVSLMGDGYTLLDIGGGESAARQAGRYAHLLKKDDAVPVYIVNPYRPWTKDVASIDGTMSMILQSVRLDRIYVLGNPTLGYSTSAEDFMEGLDRLDELMDGLTFVNSACVKRELYDGLKDKTDKYLFPMELYLTYSWVER